tara:strand:+ start:867 stop:2207 length:1341 start_codon:yes stop_codon:yes gene_type:complete
MPHTPSHRRSRVRGGGRGRAGGRATGRSAAAQKSFKKSVSKARSKGIDSRSLAQKNAALEAQQNRNRQQAQGSGDNRSAALIKQATQPIIDKNKFLMDQEQRRADILSGKITPKRSDFTGFEGGIFGLRTGNFTDTGKPKIREGLTSAQYADFMRDLYDKNPQRMEKMFPFASGKMVRDAAKFAPVIGPLTRMADSAKEKGKGILSGVQNKLSEAFSKVGDSGIAQDLRNAPGGFMNDFRNMFGMNKKDGATTETAPKRSDAKPYDASGLEGYRDAILRMNQTVSPLSQNFYGGRSPMDEAYAGLPSTQFGREYYKRFGPRENFTTVNQTQPLESSKLILDQAMKNFETPFLGEEQLFAELNPSQKAVLDQRANRFAFDQGMVSPEDMLNKIRPLDNPGIFGLFSNEANVNDIIDFYGNNSTVTMADGGSVGNFNLLKATNDEMHG